VGGGAHAELDEPFSARADPLGQESAQLPGVSAFGLCLYHVLPSWPTKIGSKPSTAIHQHRRSRRCPHGVPATPCIWPSGVSAMDDTQWHSRSIYSS